MHFHTQTHEIAIAIHIWLQTFHYKMFLKNVHVVIIVVIAGKPHATAAKI
jgi:hypothetical protein